MTAALREHWKLLWKTLMFQYQLTALEWFVKLPRCSLVVRCVRVVLSTVSWRWPDALERV
jgi:hypothetical protein